MSVYDYVILGMVVIAVGIAITTIVRRQKRGGGCSGCCGTCAHCRGAAERPARTDRRDS